MNPRRSSSAITMAVPAAVLAAVRMAVLTVVLMVGRTVGRAMAGLIMAAAGRFASSAAPEPGLCWYYTDPSRRAGFWDNCPR